MGASRFDLNSRTESGTTRQKGALSGAGAPRLLALGGGSMRTKSPRYTLAAGRRPRGGGSKDVGRGTLSQASTSAPAGAVRSFEAVVDSMSFPSACEGQPVKGRREGDALPGFVGYPLAGGF